MRPTVTMFLTAEGAVMRPPGAHAETRADFAMTVTGPVFVSIQVRDLQRSAAFYERELGLARLQATPPGVVAFHTAPISFAVREPLPGTDLAPDRPALGRSCRCAPTTHKRCTISCATTACRS